MTGPQGKETQYVEASLVDENGDLTFWVEGSVEFELRQPLPNLRWLGLTAEKRREWYLPDPNCWGRRPIKERGQHGTELLVPRRYQWWGRIVLRRELRELVVVRSCGLQAKQRP